MSQLFDLLSGLHEDGHRRTITDLLLDERFAEAERTAEAAVLIAVTDRDKPGVILTQRPTTMRDHPGQVAFPGGKLDQGEDAIAAALREADEELALAPSKVRLVGTTDPYYTGTGFRVTPVLGVVDPDLPLVAEPREVESWFEAPLDLLMSPDNWNEREAQWNGEARRYLEMHYEGYRIWGVTAAILHNLSRRLGWMEQAND